MAITAPELVSYLRDPEATDTNVALFVELANGLIDDELTSAPAWPTWVKLLAFDIAQRGWVKFSEESVDDWAGKRAAAAQAMSLTDAERRKLAALDGRTSGSSYTVPMYSPLDLP